jgi:hypothetical protein
MPEGERPEDKLRMEMIGDTAFVIEPFQRTDARKPFDAETVTTDMLEVGSPPPRLLRNTLERRAKRY